MGTARNDHTDQAQAELAEARSNVYGLLATVFRAAPGSDLLAYLRADQTARMLAEIGVSVAECLPELPEGQLVEDLAVEYTRLFVGPGPHISLYESVNASTGGRSEASLWTERTARVKAFIEEAGLHYADDFRDLPDHVSVELEFMQRLSAQEAAALREGQPDRAGALAQVQRMFFAEHLGDWMPTLCDKVIAEARHPFYRAIAELSKGVVAFERGDLPGTAETQAAPAGRVN